MQSQDQKGEMELLLVISSVLIYALGAFLFFFLLYQFSQAGYFSKAELTAGEFFFALFILVFHAILGSISLGASGVLAKKRGADTEGTAQALQIVGYIGIAAGVLGFFVSLAKSGGLGPLSQYGFMGGVVFAIYYGALSVPCIGLSSYLSGAGAESDSTGDFYNKVRCSSCGKRYPVASAPKFCETCGNPLGQKAASPGGATKTAPVPAGGQPGKQGGEAKIHTKRGTSVEVESYSLESQDVKCKSLGCAMDFKYEEIEKVEARDENGRMVVVWSASAS